jgi:hypothetical protein
MSVWKRIKFACKIYRGLIPAIWRSWRAPERLPPTREEVLEFMATGFGGEAVDLTPSCRGLTRVEKARTAHFTGNPPDAIVQALLDEWDPEEADYRSSLKMHHAYKG